MECFIVVADNRVLQTDCVSSRGVISGGLELGVRTKSRQISHGFLMVRAGFGYWVLPSASTYQAPMLSTFTNLIEVDSP